MAKENSNEISKMRSEFTKWMSSNRSNQRQGPYSNPIPAQQEYQNPISAQPGYQNPLYANPIPAPRNHNVIPGYGQVDNYALNGFENAKGKGKKGMRSPFANYLANGGVKFCRGYLLANPKPPLPCPHCDAQAGFEHDMGHRDLAEFCKVTGAPANR